MGSPRDFLDPGNGPGERDLNSVSLCTGENGFQYSEKESESAALLLEAKAHWSLGRPGNGQKDPRIGGGGAGRSQTVCCSWFAGWSWSATWVLSLFQGLRSIRQLHLTSSILSNYPKIEEHFFKRHGSQFF